MEATKGKRVLLDMDGVLVDFFSAALRVHGREDLISGWPVGESDLARVLGLSTAEFWRPIDAAGSEWWLELEWYPWADELIELCNELGGFVIATAPSRHSHSAAGKMQSLERRFGKAFRDYMMGPHKHLMAGSGMCLIDDREKLHTAFTAAGGAAVLFPQPWNRLHGEACDPMPGVRQQLGELRFLQS